MKKTKIFAIVLMAVVLIGCSKKPSEQVKDAPVTNNKVNDSDDKQSNEKNKVEKKEENTSIAESTDSATGDGQAITKEFLSRFEEKLKIDGYREEASLAKDAGGVKEKIYVNKIGEDDVLIYLREFGKEYLASINSNKLLNIMMKNENLFVTKDQYPRFVLYSLVDTASLRSITMQILSKDEGIVKKGSDSFLEYIKEFRK